jgi:murein DD-endopeptidase MepM/ murein hydrolase activator NlpD
MACLRSLLAVLFLTAATAAAPAQAQSGAMLLEGILTQGGFAKGKVPPGSQVMYEGTAVSVAEDGRFVIGFHRDEPPNTELAVTLPDGVRQSYPLEIGQRAYDIQRIDGLPPKSVTPPQQVLDRIAAEAAQVRAARARNTDADWYQSGWEWPATGRISGVFGSQRILNGEPRQPHYGIDIAAPAGTPVRAPADGQVSLVHPDMYYSGGTLMIDHGRGLASTFLHLQSIDVAEGDFVERGTVIGSVGSTGRSTGPHLDWRINWLSSRLDAALFAGPMPAE